MIIYVNGQDIHEIIFANLKGGTEEVSAHKFEVGPEGFLKSFRDFLRQVGGSLDELERIIAVIGPGSATALRSSLAVVNTLAYAKGIELIGIEKPKDEQDIDTIKKVIEQGFDKDDIKNVLMPKYEHKPRITVSTKDALRRKKK